MTATQKARLHDESHPGLEECLTSTSIQEIRYARKLFALFCNVVDVSSVSFFSLTLRPSIPIFPET